MAEVLKKLPSHRRAGRPHLYDWDTILDGRPRRLKRGSDFDCKPTSFRTTAYTAAGIRGKDVTVIIEDDNTLCIQAQPIA